LQQAASGKTSHYLHFQTSQSFNNGAGKNIVMTAAPQQRTAVAEKTEIKIETDNGGVFHHNLSKYSINRESLTEKFNFWLELSDKYSFQEISERTDELGFTHVSYQQLYKSIPIDGCVVMVHYKNGVANSINGQVSQKENIPTQQAISSERAYTVAKEHLKVSELINEYPVELLIATIPFRKRIRLQTGIQKSVLMPPTRSRCVTFLLMRKQET
jgi:Zn-dependent metalloprotease